MVNLFLCYDKCSTCKKAEQWLKDNGIPYEKRPIKEERPTAEELREWHAKSGLPIRRFFNTSGMLYRSLNVKDRLPGFKEADWTKALKK